MRDLKFNVIANSIKFWTDFKSKANFTKSNLLWIFGWFFSYYTVLYSIGVINTYFFLLVLILAFFWTKLTDDLLLKFDPPSEIVLIICFLTYLLEILYFSLTNIIPIQEGDAFHGPGAILTFLQIFVIALFTLFFSLILIQNSQGKKRVIFYYAVLGYIGFQIIRENNLPLWFLFQIFLVILLYRKTTWTEKLSRVECWVYFAIFLIVFFSFKTFPNLIVNDKFSVTNISWYYLPKLLSHLFELYLLAVLIKIPFVLVYHHASLNRKFRIAGWLQSSIPQLIQLVLLLLVFYFFIAGWQAENLRNSINNQLSKIESGVFPYKQNIHKFYKGDSANLNSVPGYYPINLQEIDIAQAVISLKSIRPIKNQVDAFFIYFQSDHQDKIVYLVKLDSLFLEEVKENIALIAASNLAVYPFQKTGWDSVLYHLRMWQNSSRYGEFRIFPFSMIPNKSDQMISLSLTDNEKTENLSNSPKIKIMQQEVFTAGRVYIQHLDENLNRNGYFAFDVLILPRLSFFSSDLAKQILFWFIIYFLVNLLVIRQVIKFGNKINQMIVNKFNQLKHGIRQISGGDLDYKIHLEGEDEFVELANRFNQMGIELKRKISEVREKDRLEYELRIAREVQLGLLPKDLPQVEGYEVVAVIQTANEVGGDFYDVIPLNNEKFLFVIGDVSGKSTSAAFYMAQCISLIRFSVQFTDQPREILLRLNKYFADTVTDKQIFVTAVIGILDRKKNSIQMFRAGHNQPLFFSKNADQKLEEIQLSGLGIGLERIGTVFVKQLKGKTKRFRIGDTLFMYTDGVTEAARTVMHNQNNHQELEFFGEKRLKQLLTENRNKTAREIKNLVLKELKGFYRNNPFIDDSTILIIQRKYISDKT